MPERNVTLRSIRDEQGSRFLGATLSSDGSIAIEGQDLGDGVEQFFGSGNREYEWIWTIRPSGVPKLAEALNAGDDVLAALKQRFSGDAAAKLQDFLEQHDIVYEVWSRIGD